MSNRCYSSCKVAKDIILLNYDVLKNPLKAEGHDTWLFSRLISDVSYAQLHSHYPKTGFTNETDLRGNPNSNSIHYVNLSFLKANFQPFNTHAIWKKFYNTVASDKYLKILGQLTQLDLSDIEIELWFMRYDTGGYLSEHYDRKVNKILTQIFYFNNDWTSSEGGHFNLLTSTEPRKTIFSVLPDGIYSTLMKCNSNAWHEVKPISGKRTRQTVNIEYFIKK